MDAPTIVTARLRLRAWEERDRAPFAALNADPVVMEHFPGPMTRAESDAMVDRIHARWAADGFGLWAVDRLDDGRFTGFVGLAPPTFEASFTPCVEIGWRLVPAAWGQGFATEAAEAALAFGFETVGLDEIQSWTIPANTRSQAVMTRIGMTHDPADDFDHPRFPEGHRLQRHVRYRLSRSRWEGSSR